MTVCQESKRTMCRTGLDTRPRSIRRPRGGDSRGQAGLSEGDDVRVGREVPVNVSSIRTEPVAASFFGDDATMPRPLPTAAAHTTATHGGRILRRHDFTLVSCRMISCRVAQMWVPWSHASKTPLPNGCVRSAQTAEFCLVTR